MIFVVHYGDRDSYGVGEDYGSTWDIIDKMVLKTYGGYAYCTFDAATGNNVLNYCDQAYEADRLVNQTIEYGVNLLDFTEKTDTNSLFYPCVSHGKQAHGRGDKVEVEIFVVG